MFEFVTAGDRGLVWLLCVGLPAVRRRVLLHHMSSRLHPAVEADLTRQAAALSQRVRGSGLYTHEVHEFEVARRVHRRVAPELGLTDLGTLTTPESRNIVRKVRRPDGSMAVLKVIGNLREPGEAEALRAWSACGLPCVRPLCWGEVPLVPGDGAPAARYLLTEYIDRPVLAVPEAASLAERERITRCLMECVSAFHAAPVMVPDYARTWVERVGVHLRWTLPLVRREQLAEPPGWQGKLEAACARDSRLLHGDASGTNALVLDDRSLVLLDPPGAIRGPREADVGHIVSCVACAGSRPAKEKVADIDPLLRAAYEAAPSLEPAAIALFAGVNLLTWAGYFLVGRVNRNVDSFGDDGDTQRPLDQASAYLAGAARLIGGHG